jgi:hypothetical protein
MKEEKEKEKEKRGRAKTSICCLSSAESGELGARAGTSLVGSFSLLPLSFFFFFFFDFSLPPSLLSLTSAPLPR